jgi:type II restriction enzyme
MIEKNISFRVKDNTQEFPDFLMDDKSDRHDLLEIKCFKNSPNFDVANFDAYCRSLREAAYRLDANYLIFKYENSDDGVLVIKNIWLKKVWQICSKSARSAIKIQWKQSVPVNIRPATWYSTTTKNQVFETRADFIAALNKVVNTNAPPDIQNKWQNTVENNYKQQIGCDL